MGIEVLRIFFRFIILVLVQVVLLNNIRLGGYINPYIYVLFVMLLPVGTPKTLLLVLSFVLGLTVDVFSNTLGLHALATVFLGFARPGILRALSPREGYEADSSPTIKQMGLQWFLIYCVIMVLIHHIVLFFAEVFRFSEFFSTLTRAFLSSIITIIIIFISQFLFGSTKTSK